MSRRDETFILYYWEDYEQYETENPSCYYCLSESTVQILLSALRFAGWRTRWRLDRNDHSRRMESNYIWNKIDYMAALAQKELITDMSCDLQAGFDALAQAIENASPNQGLLALAQAISGGRGSSGCCQDDMVDNQHGGYAGYFTQPGTGETWPIFGTEPPLGVTPETFPEGYESLEEYKLDKCQVANLVVDGAIASLRGLGALGVFNYIAVAGLVVLAITGAIIFPPAFIPIACAAIGVLAVEVTLLTLAANAIQSNREEWVCALYESESVESALSVIADLIDGLIASLDLTGPKGMAVKQIILLLVNGDTLNQLFKKVAHLSYPDADCSACVDDCFTFDTDLEGWSYRSDFGSWGLSGGYISWDASGAMNQGTTESSYSGAISDVMEWVIQEGDNIEITYTSAGGGSWSEYVGAVIDGVEVELSASSGFITAGSYYTPLAGYEGQTLEAIFHGLGRAAPWNVLITSICIVNIPPE